LEKSEKRRKNNQAAQEYRKRTKMANEQLMEDLVQLRKDVERLSRLGHDIAIENEEMRNRLWRLQ